jgi:hypothetical protein
VIDGDHQMGGVQMSVLDDRNQVRQFGDPQQGGGGWPDQMFVDDDGGAGRDHRATAAADRGMGAADGAVDGLDDGGVDGPFLKVLANVAQPGVELGGRVLGVVGIVEIDGDEGAFRIHQWAKAFRAHGSS